MKQSLVFVFLILSSAGISQKKTGLKLWYAQSSGTTWENALPLGNGRLGAMVYGNPDTEIIQLNEHTLWSGSPNRNDNPLALDSLPALRKLIFDGKQKEAEQMANRVILSKKSQGQMFEPAGNLQLIFDGHKNYTDYYRELDIERAVVKVSYKVGDVSYTREVLTSFPDRVIVINLTASRPRSISFTAFYSSVSSKR
jgi:alpha-L-fucosidase 2